MMSQKEIEMQKWRMAFYAALAALSAAAWADDPEPEFGGNCAMSAAMGTKRPTSCAVVWISPEDKLYCFSNEDAKAYFMKDPQGNERKAQAFMKDPSLWEKLKKQSPEG
jgi:hypothetical protein